MNYSPIEGTFDLLPESHKYLTFLKKVFRHEFRKNGFRRISVPILENSKLISKTGVGENSPVGNGDIVLLEDLSLGILRAYLANNCKNEIQPVYYYFLNQFYKKIGEKLKLIEAIGGEIIGVDDPVLDAIQIHITHEVLNKIGLQGKFEISINSVGIEKEQRKYRDELLNFYEGKKHILTKESLENLEMDPILVLKAKSEDEIILNSEAPKFTKKFLKKESKAHYEKFRKYLDILKVPYKEDNSLIYRNPYDTNSIWEFRSLDGKIISQGARHNNLAKNIGETKDLPATGFWLDTKLVIEMIIKYGVKIKNKDEIDLAFVQLSDEAKELVLDLALETRKAGIITIVSFGTPSLKEQMLNAQRLKAKFIVKVGLVEARNGLFQVSDERKGTQEEVKKEHLIDYIIEKIGKDKLDFYLPENDFLIK